jgi:hypothetical protein
MKRSVIPFLVVVIGLIATAFLPAWTSEAPTAEQIKTMKRDLDSNERELQDFQDLLETLADNVHESSNSDRRSAIEDIQEAMKTEILQMEKLLGQSRTIIRHGSEVREYDGDDEDSSDSAYSSDRMEGMMELGDGGRDPELYRLARMQVLFGGCKKIREEAINGTDWATDRYQRNAAQFAGLMHAEIVYNKTVIRSSMSKAGMMN